MTDQNPAPGVPSSGQDEVRPTGTTVVPEQEQDGRASQTPITATDGQASAPVETTGTGLPDPADNTNTGVANTATELTTGSVDQDQTQRDFTTITTTVTTTSNNTQSSAPSISPEAAAGIGIGSAVASALLVFVAMFLLTDKKRKAKDTKALETVQRTPTPQAQAYGRRPTDQGHAAIAVNFLPEPVAHSDLRNDINSLIAGIKHCVDNYFRENRIVLSAGAETNLQAIAGRPGGSQTWAALLAEPTLCHFIIRSLMAQILLEWINPRSKGRLTLLAVDLRGSYQRFLADTPAHGRKKGRPELLSLWRTTSCTLSSSPRSHDSQTLHEQSVALASALEPLRPLKRGNYTVVLQGLVEEASRLGMTLWAQPDDWEATWSDGHLRGEARVCVFPAVDFVHAGSKTSLGHDGARRIRLVEAVIEHTA